MSGCAAPCFPVAAQAMQPRRTRTKRHTRTSGTCAVALAAAVLLLASGCGLCFGKPLSEVDGKELYLSACASCHGASGCGDGPVARALKSAPPDLTQLARTHGGEFPRALVIETITGERTIAAHGTREMPVWSRRFGTGGFGAPAVASVYAHRNVEALTTYIESIQQPTR
jgi:mono/diheme cytochrome c family protein